MERIRGSEWVQGSGGSRIPAKGGARAIWHSTEGSSIEGAIGAYRSHGGWPHVTWDPRNGRIVQHLSPSQSAKAVQNRPGGVETNRYGTVLQIEVVAFARHPFTSGPVVGLDRIMEWLDRNGVPRGWPMGQPLAYGPDERRPGVTPAAYGLANPNRAPFHVWLNRGGHYAHSQVPENDHGDPGRVNIALLGGSGSAAPVPVPPKRKKARMFAVHLVNAPEVGYPKGALFVGVPGAWLPVGLGDYARALDEGHFKVKVNGRQWDLWNKQLRFDNPKQRIAR